MDNTMQKIIEQLDNGTLHIIKDGDTFRFSCNQCGRCCRNRDDIILTSFDVYRAAKFLEITPKEFIQKYCIVHFGKDTKLPVITVRFKEGAFGNTICSLLTRKEGKSACRIQPAKPFVCAAFPLGRFWGSGYTATYFLQDDACQGGMGKTYTLETWFKEFNLYGTDNIASKFYDMVCKVIEHIDLQAFLDSEKIPVEIKVDFYEFLLTNLYEDLYGEKDFLTKITKNANMMAERVDNLVKQLKKIDKSVLIEE